MAGEFLRHFQHDQLFAVLANHDLIACVHLERRNVDLATVHGNVTVADQLASLTARNCESETVDNVIESAFQLLQQDFAGDALGLGGLLEVVAELAFLREVHALGLLLFTQLETVTYDLRLAIFAVLTGREVALFDRALVGEALCAFKEQLLSFAAAKSANCIFITSQLESPSGPSRLGCGGR